MRFRGVRRGLIAAAVMLALPAVDAGVHEVAQQLGAKQEGGEDTREAWGGALGAAVLTGAWGVARAYARRRAAEDAAADAIGRPAAIGAEGNGAGLDVVPVTRGAFGSLTPATGGPGI